RMLGTFSSLNASQGAKASPATAAGGVWGKVRLKAANARDATPATRKVLVKASCIAVPVFGVASALPSQEANPPACSIDGTFAQSIGMNTNGQATAIQPIVPQTRIVPKSFCGSLTLAKTIALVTDMVGTKKKQCSSIRPKNGQYVVWYARPSIARPPI